MVFFFHFILSNFGINKKIECQAYVQSLKCSKDCAGHKIFAAWAYAIVWNGPIVV